MKNKTKWQEITEKSINAVFMLCGIVAVGFVLCITVHLVIAGLPAIVKIGIPEFIFGTTWQPTASTVEPSFGILPFILTSIYGTAGAVLIGVPVGLLTAIFLSKAAPPKFARVGWHPFRCLRPCRHDYTCSRHPGDVFLILWCHPSGSHYCADHHDFTVNNQRI